jgi:hypothetical protein
MKPLIFLLISALMPALAAAQNEAKPPQAKPEPKPTRKVLAPTAADVGYDYDAHKLKAPARSPLSDPFNIALKRPTQKTNF